ncbi:hypothetical protein BMS3Abin04_00533 [bacterium BMS3Abin04]|nr:hypothetical protein BMS3Abin04_00533 [bacterium BMS3Abin04]
MQVNGVGNNINRLHEQYKQNSKSKEVKQKNTTDKIEISEEAKLLQSKNVDAQEISKVRDKIDNGFYNSDEVLNKVADKILKEFEKE